MIPSYPNERRDGLPELAAHGASTTESWTSAGSQSSDSDRVLTDPEQAGAWSSNADAVVKITRLRDALHDVQREFLKIEKFANLNTTACYKILKKHDKLIPATVCCRYYMERSAPKAVGQRGPQRRLRGADVGPLREVATAAVREGERGAG